MPTRTVITVICILCAAVATALQIPFIPNVIIVPLSNSTSITVTNRTCDQCLCDSQASHAILNCFPNATCEFFVNAPRSYTVNSTPNAFLYFPRQVFPKASECWMPNTTFLLSQLNNATPAYVFDTTPLCLLLEDHGYLVTASQSDRPILRFDPNNLTKIDLPASPTFSQAPTSLAHRRGAYYVGFDQSISVVDSSNMSQIHNITTVYLSGTRDMSFLNDGQLMIVLSTGNGAILFFNRSSPTSYNYDFIGHQYVSGGNPHGLFHVDDSLFYLTSWHDNTVYSYSKTGNITQWKETLLFNAWSYVGASSGFHVSVDSSDRYWFSMGTYGVKIFTSNGTLLDSLSLSGFDIFDTLIADNFVIYLSDKGANQIIRIDPNVQC